MRISAKADYAMRAMLELAAADDPPLKRDEIAQAQKIPVKFLETILGANMREVLEGVTLADVVGQGLPGSVEKIAAKPEAWVSH